jgi:hypothetical protein
MRGIIAAALVAACFATPALAQSPLDGTWRVDIASAQLPTRPFVVSLADGTYACRSCVPAWSVPADGAFHRVADQPYFDEASVRIADGRTAVVTTRKNGQLVGESTLTVAADGNSYTAAWRDVGPNGQVATGSGTSERVAPAPAGAHGLSGSWRQQRVNEMSDSATTFQVRTQGETFHMTFPTGESYAAPIGGAAVPIEGDGAGTHAAVRRIAPNVYEATETRNGEVVSVTTMTLADPATMNVVSQNRRLNTEVRYSARRQ